jgi:hypothetical protein
MPGTSRAGQPSQLRRDRGHQAGDALAEEVLDDGDHRFGGETLAPEGARRLQAPPPPGGQEAGSCAFRAPGCDTLTAMTTPKGARRGRGALVLAGVVGASALLAGGALRGRDAARAEAREAAAQRLAELQRCLAGEPLRPGESLGGRLRGVELAAALEALARTEPRPADAGADAVPPPQADAGPADAGPADAGPADAGPAWPVRCSPYAEALARRLEEAGDPALEPLREALPSPARGALPYALFPDEAAELEAALGKAALPARAATNEPAPPALAPPIAAKAAPLGKGRAGVGRGQYRNRATDLLQTRTLHLLVRDAEARLCALEAEGPAGPYGVARCGALPGLIMDEIGLPLAEDGAPTAVIAAKALPRTDPRARSEPFARGVLVLGPGDRRAIPANQARADSFETFLAADGAYMIAAYSPLVRIGTVAALRSDDLAGPPADRAVSATTSVGTREVAAYGVVFFNDRPPVYSSFDQKRRFHGRRVLPELDAAATDLGSATADDLTALDGCRAGDTAAVLFATYAPGKARLVLARSGGALVAMDAETGGAAPPHLACARDGFVVTSVQRTEPSAFVVVQARCAGSACTTTRSAPVTLPAADDVDAATYDGGVALVWRTRSDQVTSAARGMAFARVGPLADLAAAAPRPLFEGARRGGFEAARLALVPRPQAIVAVLETGGKEPVTYAARLDAQGAAAAVRVEEATW